jgi:hypothetical protein
MKTIIQFFRSQSQWTNRRLNTSGIIGMDITNINVKLI